MNQLYIIGNGFDLAHGMKTSYNDFITWYLNKVYSKMCIYNKPYKDELIVAEKRCKLPDNDDISFEYFQKMVKDKYISLAIQSEFLQRMFDEVIINRWVDIEQLYFTQLLSIYNERNSSSSLDNWFLTKLNADFESISAYLKRYICVIESDTFNPISDIHQSLTNQFTKHHIGVTESQSALFLNFNYTGTLELYNDLLVKHKARIIHIHGKATDEKDNIIFGYGDEMNDHYVEIEKLNNNEYLRHFKSFNYFLKPNYRSFLNFIDSGIFKVYIMGHSCGLSDRILLNSIFEHKNCSEIQIFYHDKGNGQNDFVEKTYEISRHFSGAKKGVMRAKILPFENCDPLVRAN